MEFEPRNTPDYAILESYAHDYKNDDVLTDFAKEHICEIMRKKSRSMEGGKRGF